MSVDFCATPIPGVSMAIAIREHQPVRMFHEWYAIPILFHGEASLWYRHKTLESAPNLVSAFEPGEVHYNTWVKHFTCAVVHIDARVMRDACAELGLRGEPHFPVRGGPSHPTVIAAVKDFIRSVGKTRACSEAALSTMLGALLRHGAESAPPPVRHGCPRAIDAVVEAARNCGTCPSVAELARLQYVSERQLHRLFKAATGVSPVELFQLARVARVLNGGHEGCSMAAAAAKYGFADQSHLNRRMRRCTGSTAVAAVRGITSLDHSRKTVARLAAALGSPAGSSAW